MMMDDEQIEMVARLICEAHGVDPDVEVSVPDGGDETVAEGLCRYTYRGMSYIMPRWRTFRRAASEAIAAEFAMRGFFGSGRFKMSPPEGVEVILPSDE